MKRTSLITLFTLVSQLVISTKNTATAADDWQADLNRAIQQDKLIAFDGAENDFLGLAVSLSGDMALVGSIGHNNSEGAVYAYLYNGVDWVFQQKLIADDGTGLEQFGFAISIDGNRALIGAPKDVTSAGSSGSAYVFDFNGVEWLQTQKLIADDGGSGDEFGTSVSLDGDRLLIGSPKDDDVVVNAGAAYVFDFNGAVWSQTQKLSASDPTSAQFGKAVSLDSNSALIGAPFEASVASGAGAAFIFTLGQNNWSQQQKLTANDGAINSNFGAALSLSGTRALIGAFRDSGNANASGSAYIFDDNGSSWTQTQKLNGEGVGAGTQYASSVSLSGTRALVGARRDNANAGNSGSAFVYDFDGSSWVQTDKLFADDGAASDEFGIGVSLSGGKALVGSFRDDDQFDNSGSAYVFSVPVNISLQVSGLAAGNSVEFINNNTDNLQVDANGLFTFGDKLESTDTYNITVSNQPTSPNQTCVLSNPNGSVGDEWLILSATCTINQYPIELNVTGLAATNSIGFTNGSDQLTVLNNGISTLSLQPDESSYDVGISFQPDTPNQVCEFINSNSGTLNGSTAQINISCMTTQYIIGGAVSGLAPGNQVMVQNYGGENLILSDTGSFNFNTPLDDQSTYSVTVQTQPTTPNQTCTVTSGKGTLAGKDVDSIEINCTTNSYFVAGEAVGLFSGNNLTLQNNGSDSLMVADDGGFVFNIPVTDQSSYNAIILFQPTDPIQPCELSANQGTIQGEDVTDLVVLCQAGDDLIFGNGLEETQ